MKQLIIFNIHPDEIKYTISTDIDFTKFNGVYINEDDGPLPSGMGI